MWAARPKAKGYLPTKLGAGPELLSPGTVAFSGLSSGPPDPCQGSQKNLNGAEWAELLGPKLHVLTEPPSAWEGGLVILLTQMRKSVERVQFCCPMSRNW